MVTIRLKFTSEYCLTFYGSRIDGPRSTWIFTCDNEWPSFLYSLMVHVHQLMKLMPWSNCGWTVHFKKTKLVIVFLLWVLVIVFPSTQNMNLLTLLDFWVLRAFHPSSSIFEQKFPYRLQILRDLKSIPSIGLVLQGLSLILTMKTHLMDMTKYIQIFNLLTLRASNNFFVLAKQF
jgi:hypothetical protein